MGTQLEKVVKVCGTSEFGAFCEMAAAHRHSGHLNFKQMTHAPLTHRVRRNLEPIFHTIAPELGCVVHCGKHNDFLHDLKQRLL